MGQKSYLAHRTLADHLYRILPKLGFAVRSDSEVVVRRHESDPMAVGFLMTQPVPVWFAVTGDRATRREAARSGRHPPLSAGLLEEAPHLARRA
jgi:hypothetical protein